MGLSTAEIEERISDRERARASKDWDLADQIREDLRNDGVSIMDKECIWRGEDDSIGVYAGPKGLPEKGIRYILNYREEVRARKDWQHADALRQLLRDNGVMVFDKDGTWRADHGGLSGFVNESESRASRDSYNGGGGRRRDDYDAHRDSRHGPVRRSDRRGYSPVRSSRDGPYGRPSSDRMDQRRAPRDENASSWKPPNYDYCSGFEIPSGCVLVVDLLGKREQARAERDWVSADNIRQVLGMVGVVIHDKNGTYSLPDGEVCEIPNTKEQRN